MEQLIFELFDKGIIKFGSFTLKSGQNSTIYINLRSIISYPHLFKTVCDLYWQHAQKLNFDYICGVPYSALTFASAISYAHRIPMLLRRKEKRDYGTRAIIEGDFENNKKCLIIEDVITHGTSILETINDLEQSSLIVKDILIFIDRQQTRSPVLVSKNYNVHCIVKINDLINLLFDHKKISIEQKEKAFLSLKD